MYKEGTLLKFKDGTTRVVARLDEDNYRMRIVPVGEVFGEWFTMGELDILGAKEIPKRE